MQTIPGMFATTAVTTTGAADISLGGLPAPLVFAGAVAKQILTGRGITVGAHIRQISNVEDTSFANDEMTLTPELFRQVSEKAFPVLDDERGAEMQAEILAAKNTLDSVGGVIECAVLGYRQESARRTLAIIWKESLLSTCLPCRQSKGLPLARDLVLRG